MNQNRSIALGVVAVVVLLAGLLVANLHSGGDGNTEKALYPSLKTEADSINAVRIFKAGDTRVVELLRKDKDWTVTERGGYPADTSKVRKLIVALSDAKTVEEKTSNPASYATLGVEDMSDKESTGVRLELAGGKTPINLIVGKANADKVFVRRVGEKPSWLLNTGIDAPQLIDAWLKRELIDVGGDRIQSAQVTVGDKSYTAAKSARAEGDFKVEGLPKGKEANVGAASSFASALQGLNLSEVRTAQEFGSPPPSATATLKTFDGLVAQVTGWVQDSKRYVAIATSFDEAQAQKFSLKPVAAEPAEAAKEAPPKETRAEQTQAATPEQKARDEATAANQRFTGWVFEIPTYKYDAIFKPVDQLVKVVQPAKK
jgi:hypothetical protein